jgi:hypothetical protein
LGRVAVSEPPARLIFVCRTISDLPFFGVDPLDHSSVAYKCYRWRDATLIAKLKTLTNLRVVRDPESSTGWKLTHDPFPGWETVPTW